MQDYQMYKMTDFSNQQLEQIRRLEQLCKLYDHSTLRVGIESLKEQGGDEAFLCYNGEQVIGFLSWYTSDGMEANINAMVHPDYRRQGIFHSLLQHAEAEMRILGICTCRFRIPANSEPGINCIRHKGADFSSAEFLMILKCEQAAPPKHSHSSHSALELRIKEDQDFEFMIGCSAQAFGDSERWTRNYLTSTSTPERITYIAMNSKTPVGMIRINYLEPKLAVIHDFCVLPGYQGRGLGYEILSRAVNLLLKQQGVQVRLSVVTQNKRALALYQKAGFEISAESRYYVIHADRME